MDKFDFNCNQLKNIEIPEQWVNNALEIPSNAPKPVTVIRKKRYYRYAAAIAACLVIAAAVVFSMMFGLNKNVNLTNPPIGDSPSKSDSYNGTSNSDSTDNTNPSGKSPSFSAADNSPSDFVTEPSENSGDSGTGYGNQGARIPSNSKETKAGNNAKPNSDSTKQNVTSPEPSGEKPEPSEEKETVNIKMIDTDDWAIGALPDDTPKPTRPIVTEVYGCSFLTSADRSLAEGKTYYCRIQDESGKVLGSGTAQKYDWGNPDWPLDIKYTAGFVMYYGQNYTVTFYDSNGATVWSGTVYLEQDKDSYLLY